MNMVWRVASVLLLVCGSRGGWAAPYDDIIAFGDSLTEVGNVAGVTRAGHPPRISGYYPQTGNDPETHFCDNIIWIEHLAAYWSLPARTPGRGDLTSQPPKYGSNTWAWGGSEAGAGMVQPPGVTEPVPNLALQISTYLSHNKPDQNTLYILWSGANNLLVGGKFGPAAAATAADAVKRAMQILEAAGARQLLVLAMPKLGDTPRAQAGGFIKEAAATEFAVVYNTTLKAGIDELRLDPFFDAKIFEVDIYSELKRVFDTVKAGSPYQPDFFVPGPPVTITNVTNQGLEFFQASGKMPTGYLFWDDLHPTCEGHRLIAGLVIRTVGESQSGDSQSP